ncbi:fumarylacetoacetate hydrolase [Streptomyces sp. SID8382]|uniref:fumarylacetoacetate hydrolase family protein n=1 Tax=Streptomyces malaysiensis TaxID=92644 RepID=UPI000C2C2C5C|nr:MULTISPECIES: fumarylacetoacetate hydrolase family protein [unclassified Streptomyces]AUA08535.1 Ureidoglycolate lyase [Streptomyces sp. M56]MYX59726.1 fumarylacetoacetate hydrolase [Streptomyces sp. SID8382]
MRIASIQGRAALVSGTPHRAIDVEHASDGSFGPAPQALYDRWDEFVAWARTVSPRNGLPFDVRDLRAPVPAPRQVFAIGLNYRDHASESGFSVPKTPTTLFTKWPSCLTGPVTEVVLPADGHTDWEVELVAVVGRTARNITAPEAWDHIAGVTVGQDLSERKLQRSGPAPQFGLGKSLPGFGPTGPWVVTPDELPDRDDVRLQCVLNGETMQDGRTRDLVFPVARLVASLSALLPLLPGDLVFTGTPAGVGLGRTPERWLRPGDELVSRIEGIGELRQTFVPAPHP